MSSLTVNFSRHNTVLFSRHNLAPKFSQLRQFPRLLGPLSFERLLPHLSPTSLDINFLFREFPDMASRNHPTGPTTHLIVLLTSGNQHFAAGAINPLSPPTTPLYMPGTDVRWPNKTLKTPGSLQSGKNGLIHHR